MPRRKLASEDGKREKIPSRSERYRAIRLLDEGGFPRAEIPGSDCCWRPAPATRRDNVDRLLSFRENPRGFAADDRTWDILE